MSDKDFVNKYLNDFSSLLKPSEDLVNKIVDVKNILTDIRKSKNKIMIFGNGGSAAIASHVSVDLTKNANVRCVNYNEADLITCFSNDYGYERWIEKAVDFSADANDVLILISSSGKSQNMLNACKAAKNKKISKIITFTGHDKNNLPLGLQLIGKAFDEQTILNLSLAIEKRANFKRNYKNWWT